MYTDVRALDLAERDTVKLSLAVQDTKNPIHTFDLLPLVMEIEDPARVGVAVFFTAYRYRAKCSTHFRDPHNQPEMPHINQRHTPPSTIYYGDIFAPQLL